MAARRLPFTRLKLTAVFRAVQKQGLWLHSAHLSFGLLANDIEKNRIGLRLRHGLRRAVVRNRLKRQLRAIVAKHGILIDGSFDIVIVIHPRDINIDSTSLEKDYKQLCKKIQQRLQKKD